MIEHIARVILGIFLVMAFFSQDTSAENLTRYSAVRMNMLAEIIRVKPEINMILVRNTRGAKLVHKFYGFSKKLNSLHPGQRVRIYYRKDSRQFERIELMTELEYTEGQNLGNIYKQEK